MTLKLKVCAVMFSVALAAGIASSATAAPMGATENSDDTGLGPSSGLKLPRYAALAASEVNFRKGPGEQYPINWVYRREGLPVRIVREFGDWRRVVDPDGYEGWVKEKLLTGQRTGMVLGTTRLLFENPDTQSKPLWRVQAGVTGKIVICEDAWCQMNIEGKTGYILRVHLWGTEKDENFN
jgi:SH3-like domain-containing protein